MPIWREAGLAMGSPGQPQLSPTCAVWQVEGQGLSQEATGDDPLVPHCLLLRCAAGCELRRGQQGCIPLHDIRVLYLHIGEAGVNSRWICRGNRLGGQSLTDSSSLDDKMAALGPAYTYTLLRSTCMALLTWSQARRWTWAHPGVSRESHAS